MFMSKRERKLLDEFENGRYLDFADGKYAEVLDGKTKTPRTFWQVIA